MDNSIIEKIAVLGFFEIMAVITGLMLLMKRNYSMLYRTVGRTLLFLSLGLACVAIIVYIHINLISIGLTLELREPEPIITIPICFLLILSTKLNGKSRIDVFSNKFSVKLLLKRNFLTV